jgi:hypothetical protein
VVPYYDPYLVLDPYAPPPLDENGMIIADPSSIPYYPSPLPSSDPSVSPYNSLQPPSEEISPASVSPASSSPTARKRRAGSKRTRSAVSGNGTSLPKGPTLADYVSVKIVEGRGRRSGASSVGVSPVTSNGVGSPETVVTPERSRESTKGAVSPSEPNFEGSEKENGPKRKIPRGDVVKCMFGSDCKNSNCTYYHPSEVIIFVLAMNC